MKLSNFAKIIRFTKNTINFLTPCPIQDLLYKLRGGGAELAEIEFHIVDHCNLNCAYCDHFTPLAKENFIKVEDIIEDFKKLKKIFDNIKKIYILGGEPLLHPNLADIFEPLRKLYPKSKLIIITNGILLNKQDDSFWQMLKKYDVALSMTKYPIKVDYEGYVKKCEQMGIKAYFFSLNRDKMQKLDLDPKGKSNKKLAYQNCSRKRCTFIRDGKLYGCTPLANIEFLNKYFNLDFKVTNRDYIDINKVKSPSKILKKISRPTEFCKYCREKDMGYFEYKTSKKELSEWVREN